MISHTLMSIFFGSHQLAKVGGISAWWMHMCKTIRGIMKVKLAASNNAINDKTTVHYRRETIFRLGAWLIRLRAGFAVVCKVTTNCATPFSSSRSWRYSTLINTVIKWEVVLETNRTYEPNKKYTCNVTILVLSLPTYHSVVHKN